MDADHLIRALARRRHTAGLLLCLAMVGCIKQAPYVVPSSETAPAFKEDPNWKAAAPADSTLRGNWWEAFNDSELNALEDQIAISNQMLKSAEAQLQAARAEVRIARSAFGPQVST